MTILRVTERRPRDDSRTDGNQDASRWFNVICDTPNESPRDVSRAEDPDTGLAVPRYGEQLTETSPQIVKEKRLTRNESAPRVWIVECRYGLPSESERTDQANQQDLPELEAPTVRVTSESEEVVRSFWWRMLADGSFEKQAAVNLAGMKFPEGFAGKIKNPIVELTRNISSDTDVIGRKATFDGTYCKDPVFGIPVPVFDPTTRTDNQRRARMLDMTYQKFFRFSRTTEEEELIHEYWQETLTIGFYQPTEILNQGTHYLFEAYPEAFPGLLVLTPFTEAGRPRVGLLDVNGGPLGGFDAAGHAKGVADIANPPVYLDNVFETKPIQWEPTLELPDTLNDVQAILYYPRR